MTKIKEDFTDIALVGADVTVSFHGRPIRPTSTTTGLVTPKRVSVRAVDGKITSPELDPGPCEVLIETGRWKRDYSIVVPPEGIHRLRDLIETYEVPDPPAVSLVKKYRDETKEARDVAVAAAEGVAGISDDLEQIADDRAAAELARDKAIEARQASEGAAGSASSDAADAINAARDAKDFRDAAEGFASEADGSARAAGQSESAASRHKDDAEAAAELAGETAAGIQDVAQDAAQVAQDRLAVESAAAAVSADRQTVTDALDVVVTAKGDVQQIQTDVGQTKTSIENTANLVDQTLEQYGAQFISERDLSQQAVTDATTQAQRSEDASDIAVGKADDASRSALEAKQFRDEAQGAVAGVSSFDGVSGAVTKAHVGLDQVDNTRDADKAISTETRAALDGLSENFVELYDGVNTAIGNLMSDVDTSLATKADVDGSGKILAAQIPAEARASFRGVTYSEAGMLELGGERGDWCTRGDRGTDFRLIANPASVPTNWLEATYPASPVSSVNGRTGAVDTSSADITDATAVGRASIRASDQAAGRAAIGAGTGNSNLELGTTSATAMRGDGIQSVASLPGSPVAGILYCIPE